VIRGISRVGDFRVATPTDIRACLAKQRVNMGPLPRQNDPFNKGAFDCGLTSTQRAWILSYYGKFASCRECEKDAGGCVHFPSPELMDDERLLEVPIVFKHDEVVLTLILVSRELLIREYARDKAVMDSIMHAPLARSQDASGNSSFCSGVCHS
jgi:hypothetical protein